MYYRELFVVVVVFLSVSVRALITVCLFGVFLLKAFKLMTLILS